MKIMIVMGTRPEVIKLAPVVNALRKEIEVTVCASGQHKEMLAQALGYFCIEPDISLKTMRAGQSLNALSAQLLTQLDGALEQVCPDWVIVQGDTTTAFCAALAAFHRSIPIAHVEAGLRTGDLASPFPEEANRCLLSRIATRHFAPTELARMNLMHEGVADQAIVVTGNTVVDAIAHVQQSWSRTLPQLSLPEWGGAESSHILVTCHRRENFGDTLAGICKVLRDLCQCYADFRWIFPVHLNPAVREPVMHELGNISNLVLLEPVDYPTSLYLISRSALVVSDSGGIQEEAPTFGVPVVVMRSRTERREGIDAGFATLAGQSADSIETAVRSWLDNPEKRRLLSNRPNPYGDGRASQRIVASILERPVEVGSD